MTLIRISNTVLKISSHHDDTYKAMKNRLTFLLITSKLGVQRRFSINRALFYFLVLCSILLICSGTIGGWKAGENLELSRTKIVLEAEQQHMQTIAKAVSEIEQQEIAMHDLLGIKDGTQPTPSEPDGT